MCAYATSANDCVCRGGEAKTPFPSTLSNTDPITPQVYERLYRVGVVKVKKQQHMQEQKRIEDEQALENQRQQVSS